MQPWQSRPSSTSPCHAPRTPANSHGRSTTIVFGFVGSVTSSTWLVVDLMAVQAAKRRGAEPVWKENMWVLMEDNRNRDTRYGLKPVSSGT
jgi:hypothetical protein